ncbi:MAG TPA: transposase [Thermodesulfobacteriota bacterium]|nr:transposase [Thermodesulfobacteriota bacterium]
MPRGPRLDTPGTLHHVIVRGIERRPIFKSERDREDFVARLGQVVGEGQASCFAWVLIPNHAHILLRTGVTPLSKMMRRVLTGYAVSLNLRHQRSGHLFQNRYKSIVCEEDSYLLELIRYIHLNLIRAGLVKSMKGLDRYPWSGHSVLMGYESRPWQATEEVLSYFGRGQGVARKKYWQFIFEGLSMGRREELMGGTKRQAGEERDRESERRIDSRIPGSGRFAEQLLAEEEREIQQRALIKRRRVEVEELVGVISKEFGVNREQIIGRSQRQTASRARSVFCYLGSRKLGLTGRELAQALSLSPAAVHYAVVRGESFLQQNKNVGKRLLYVPAASNQDFTA